MKKPLTGYKLVAYYMGIFMIMIGCIVLTPLIVLAFYPEEYVYAPHFVIPGMTTILVGYLLHYFLKKGEVTQLQKHQDSLLVLLVWVLAITISSIPWMMTGKYNFTQAVFECTSGYTTTGLSVVTPEECPKIFLMFRSIMLFVGGIGLVLVMSCAISDRWGLRLFNAEGHTDKLLPNLKKSARAILLIYSTYIILGVIAYCIAGMNLFDAINHSIAALSTGGFSTKNLNILAYHSVAIDIISDVLMLLGGTNFLVHLYLFRGQIKKVWKHCETKFIIFFSLAMFPIMTLMLYFNDYANFGESMNIAFFQYVSALTTTGFSNVADTGAMPSCFKFMMIIMMLIGAGIGSTGGGIKQYRIVAATKGLFYNFKRGLSPRRTIFTHYIDKTGSTEELTDEEIASSHNYIILYLLIFFLGSLIFTCYGHSLDDAMFEFASALGTVGISVGVTGYNAPALVLWTGTLGMFFGRLEILVVFNAFARIGKAMIDRKTICRS